MRTSFLKSLVLIGVATLSASPLLAVAEDSDLKGKHPRIYWQQGDWAVVANEGAKLCTASKLQARTGGVMLSMERRIVGLAFFASPTSNFPEIGNADFILKFTGQSGVEDFSWGQVNFSFAKKDDHYIFTSFLMEPVKLKKLLTDLASNDGVEIGTNENGKSTVVSSIDLQGANKVIPRLKECALTVAGLELNDPFFQ